MQKLKPEKWATPPQAKHPPKLFFLCKLILGWLLFLSLALVQFAQADIYKYIDEYGNVTFTNKPMKGALRILVEPALTRKYDKKGGHSSPSVSPTYFPKVYPEIQKERDQGRRRILEDELIKEERLLADTQKAFTDFKMDQAMEKKQNSPKYVQRIERFQENMVLHEKNIMALKTELNRTR